MKKLSKKNKIIIVTASVLLLFAILAGVLTMFLYVPSSFRDGVNDDIRFRISYFDYENYYFQNGDTVMPFRLKYPKNAEEGKKYPLCIFLHGGGSQGMDNIKSMCGFYLRNYAKYGEEAYVLVPQVPSDDRDWDAEMIETINRCIEEFLLPNGNVDEARIYLSGSSMGGRGSVLALTMNPERYAAAMFDAGRIPYGEPDETGFYPEIEISDATYAALKNTPMLISHGLLDDVVPIVSIQSFVSSLNAAGNDQVTLKVWDNLGHETVNEFYGDEANWKWLFSQRKAA